MPSLLSRYLEVKDKVCLSHFGDREDYVTLLRLLRPNVTRQFPGVRVHLGCRDGMQHLFRGEPDTLTWSEMKSRRRDFGATYDVLQTDDFHGVEAFMEDSGVALKLETPSPEVTEICAIHTQGPHPMPRDLEDACRMLALRRGFEPQVSPNRQDVGLAIGVECVATYEAAAAGIETILVPTGNGESLFRKLFPGQKVLDLGLAAYR